MPTEEGKGYPKGVVWPGLVNVNLEEPETTLYSDDCLFIRDTETEITGEFKPAKSKMSRKRFKKLLMSKGVSRNAAEQRCNLVAANHGTYAWFGVCCTLFGFTHMAYFEERIGLLEKSGTRL